MNPEKNKIVILGAGNVATQLGLALYENEFPIIQVYSRTLASAEILGKQLKTAYTANIQDINTEADMYIFAIKDSALPSVLKNMPPANKSLWVHVAGSVPLDVFAGYTERYGVLYPLQTFSKSRKISFSNIPFFIEANNSADELLLENVAFSLSDKVMRFSSEKRKLLHLAAVFACNFTNHLYTLSTQILEKHGIDRNILLPLIQETAFKINDLHPRDAQTGPAVRNDDEMIGQHLEILDNQPLMKEIYRLLSESISRDKINGERDT
ncbi:MAG: DUF2520 domain-containing protein [Dysgonamonadaceae bacterium]|jgi:predicted short-subunit dehydrogenase-like oxidoreductase (DUF2520 family)|nr:DUF2520 domain-containing protein [Dysgonamonadaceae bacterium]